MGRGRERRRRRMIEIGESEEVGGRGREGKDRGRVRRREWRNVRVGEMVWRGRGWEIRRWWDWVLF